MGGRWWITRERIYVSQERLLEQPGLTEPTTHAGDRRAQ
jgi:hypothetical protein